MLLVLGVIALVVGLFLVFVENETEWFGYGPPSDGIVLTEASFAIVTHRDMYGYSLIALAALIAAGLFGYRLGARRRA